MKTLLQRQSITSQGGFYEPKEGHAKVRKENHSDRQEVQGIHGRGTSRDEGVPPRAEGIRGPRPARGQGGRGKRRAREDRRDAGTGSRHGQAAPRDYQSQRARSLAEDLVRDARVCQGRRGRLLLPTRAEVQNEVRDARLQRRREPRRRRLVAGRLRAEGVDCHGRGKDQRAREESGELRPGIWGVFRCMVYPCVTRADPRRSGRSGPLSPAFFCNVSTVPHSSSPNNGSSSFPTACHIPIDEMLSRTGCFFYGTEY